MSDKNNRKSIIKHIEAYAAIVVLATGTVYAAQGMGRITLALTVVVAYFCARTITRSFK